MGQEHPAIRATRMESHSILKKMERRSFGRHDCYKKTRTSWMSALKSSRFAFRILLLQECHMADACMVHMVSSHVFL